MRNMFRALGIMLVIAGCNSIAPRDCTLIGCNDGISVELTGTLPQTYRVTARENGQVVATVDCSPQRSCAGGIFLTDVKAARVEIEVTGTGLDVRREVTPAYTVSQPNGPGCPPRCRQARVQFAV